MEQTLGHDNGIKVKMPIVIPGLGSTNIARNNWEGLAIGAAISGIIVTIGENVCGMDPESTIKKGMVQHSPQLEKRVRLFQQWQSFSLVFAINRQTRRVASWLALTAMLRSGLKATSVTFFS